MVKEKIIYLHPAIRTYRVGIFEMLSEKLNIFFFWTGISKPHTHSNEEINRILKKTNIDYMQARELHSLPMNGFSFDLLKIPFLGCKLFIFSSIISVPYLLLAPILKLMGKKIIVFDELWRYPKEVVKYRIIFPYVKFLSKHCLHGVVAAGSKSKQFYLEELDFDKNKIQIAFNTTIDTKEYTKNKNIDKIIKTKIKKITDKKIILYLGRIVKYKGLDLLIKAMLNISKEYALIVLGDGEFKSECQILVNELNLNERVHFLGSCLSYEAPYYMKNSDIFVLPSRFRLDSNVQMESWGFTVNEAMALEIPVVTTTAVGSAYDLIIDGITGGLAIAGEQNSLNEKINFIIENRYVKNIGKNSRKHLLKTCNYKRNFESYEVLVRKVLLK